MPLNEVMELNQAAQLGLETTHGTSPGGGAGKYLASTMFGLDPNISGNGYAASGHWADGVWVPNYDYSDLTADGPMTYDEMSYLLSMHYGAPTITTPTGATLARKHAYAPPLTGIVDPSSYLVQVGGSVRAAQANFAVLADFGFEASRKEMKLSGCKGFAQQFSDGITMTASPTKVGQHPILPEHWNVYLDTTSAGIGTTQLLRCYKVTFKSTGAHTPNWPGGRQFSSYATLVNQKPKRTLTLSLMHDSAAGALFAPSRAGSPVYIRFECIGDEIEAGSPNQFRTFVMDWAAVPQPKSRKADTGAWTIDVDFNIIEDAAWTEASASGTYLYSYLVNTLTAL